MNYTVYIIDLALAFVLLWVAFILHVSDNGGKHVDGDHAAAASIIANQRDNDEHH